MSNEKCYRFGVLGIHIYIVNPQLRKPPVQMPSVGYKYKKENYVQSIVIPVLQHLMTASCKVSRQSWMTPLEERWMSRIDLYRNVNSANHE